MTTTVATVEAAPARVDTAPAALPRTALTTRFLDFWLLGGASILIWLVMVGSEAFRTSWAVDQHFRNLTFTAASLSLIINYPHFLVSYQLAYRRGRTFVATHWWQLVAVPVALLGIFALAYVTFDTPIGQLPLVPAAAGALGGVAGLRLSKTGSRRREAGSVRPVCPGAGRSRLVSARALKRRDFVR